MSSVQGVAGSFGFREELEDPEDRDEPEDPKAEEDWALATGARRVQLRAPASARVKVGRSFFKVGSFQS